VSEPKRAIVKLRFWRTIGEALRLAFGDVSGLVRCGWLPFLIVTAPGLAFQFFAFRGTGGTVAVSDLSRGMSTGLWILAMNILFALGYTGFVVAWYRRVLRAEDNVSSPRGYWAAFWRVFGYGVLFAIGLYAAFLVAGVLGSVGIAVTSLASRGAFSPTKVFTWIGGAALVMSPLLLACCVRLSLVFPASAYGMRLGLRGSWRQTRGNTWRMTGALFILVLVSAGIIVGETFLLSGEYFSELLAGRIPQTVTAPSMGLALTVGIIGRVLMFVLTAVTINVIAIGFRDLALYRSPALAEVFA
jgi:hypothetical protein